MNPTLRNVLVTILGLLIGGVVNMQIITHGGSIIPLPECINPEDLAKPEIIANLPALNYIPVFLAHALGTFVAAFIACKLAVSQKNRIALVVGVFFLLGGITASFMIKPPIWYIIVDLVFAYLPMAFAGKRLAGN